MSSDIQTNRASAGALGRGRAPMCALLAGLLALALPLTGCGGGGGGPAVTVTVAPAAVSLVFGATQAFTATVANSTNAAVTWSATAGTITATGLYTAPATVGAFTVTATSVADPSKHGVATVTVTGPPPVGVSLSPATAALVFGASQSFTATVTNAANLSVTWSVDGGAPGGTITGGGVYTAPATAGVYTVRATSVADATKSGTARVTVTPPVAVTVTPAAVTLPPSGVRTFIAAVANTTNTAVTWSVDGGAGAITAAGVFTAPTAAGTCTVRATSVADPTRSGTAVVTVPSPPSVVSAFSASAYTPGVGLVVRLTVTPLGATAAYAVEDRIPPGWTVDPASISDGGVYDAITRKVKWGLYFDNAPRTLSYTATPPVGASGDAAFTGVGAFDGQTTAIVGDRTLSN